MINFVLIPNGSYMALSISQYNPVPSLLVALVHSSLAMTISLGLLPARAGEEIEHKNESNVMQIILLSVLGPLRFTVLGFLSFVNR